MDLLREYQKEHPEECIELNKLKENSKRIDSAMKQRAVSKLERIEQCRRLLKEGKVKMYG